MFLKKPRHIDYIYISSTQYDFLHVCSDDYYLEKCLSQWLHRNDHSPVCVVMWYIKYQFLKNSFRNNCICIEFPQCESLHDCDEQTEVKCYIHKCDQGHHF